MIVITVDGKKVTFADGKWTGANSSLAKMCNEFLATLPEPWGSDPYPDYTLAQQTANFFGGTITRFDPAPISRPGEVN